MKAKQLHLDNSDTLYLVKYYSASGSHSIWKHKEDAEKTLTLLQNEYDYAVIEEIQLDPVDSIVTGKMVLLNLSTGKRTYDEECKENQEAIIIPGNMQKGVRARGWSYNYGSTVYKPYFLEIDGIIHLRQELVRDREIQLGWKPARIFAVHYTVEQALALAEEHRVFALQRIEVAEDNSCGYCSGKEYKTEDIHSDNTRRQDRGGKWFCSNECYHKYRGIA